MQTLTSAVTGAQTADRIATATSSREARAIRRNRDASGPVVLRLAHAEDGPKLADLADLDSAPVPHGDVLLAEVDGQVAAALPLDGGRAIADPFRQTAGLVEMLRIRAAA